MCVSPWPSEFLRALNVEVKGDEEWETESERRGQTREEKEVEDEREKASYEDFLLFAPRYAFSISDANEEFHFPA